MLHLPDPGLDPRTDRGLRKYQEEVDRVEPYAERVETGKTLFTRYNRESNSIFRVVRQRLSCMCGGVRRCGYCEDSAANEIDHFRPKNLYPDQVFVWQNYLPSCSPCNRRKGSRFAVIRRGCVVDAARSAGATPAPPLPGSAALVDPRTEDPLRFLVLEIVDTFRFLPREDLNALDGERAEYTIRALQLNRGHLPESRRNAYGDYRARLSEYSVRRRGGAGEADLRALREGVLASPHPTVWREMQRQHEVIAELGDLFAGAPEALSW